MAATFRCAPPVRHASALEAAAFLGHVRVTGTLDEDARVAPTTGTPPHLLLWLSFRPITGLPYTARIDLGDDLHNHTAARELLPFLRRGAVVSVAAQGLEPRTDHGHAALRLVMPHAVVLLQDPLPPDGDLLAAAGAPAFPAAQPEA